MVNKINSRRNDLVSRIFRRITIFLSLHYLYLLRTRNKLIRKLITTLWGTSAHVLRTSVLGLVYPTAEYCASVWLNSVHTDKVDVQLNESMRLITGTIQSTPLYWLPTLSNIAPANLRRQQILLREYRKIMANPELPIHIDININLPSRLKSRHSPLLSSLSVNANNFTINDKWLEEWKNNGNQLTKITGMKIHLDLTFRGNCGVHWTESERIAVNAVILFTNRA